MINSHNSPHAAHVIFLLSKDIISNVSFFDNFILRQSLLHNMSIVSPIRSATRDNSKSPWSLANRFSDEESAHGVSEHARFEDETSNCDPILFQIYESDDSSMRGTLDEVSTLERINNICRFMREIDPTSFPLNQKVLAYERSLTESVEPVLLRIYESPDGFRGFYDEVVEHEREYHISARTDNAGVKE